MEGHYSQRRFDRSPKSDHDVCNFTAVVWHSELIIILVMRATEMGVGLDSKRGLRKVSHARAYRKYAEETLHIATVSIPSSESPQETTYLAFGRRSLNEPGILTSLDPHTKHTTTRNNLHAPSLQQRPPIDLTSATRTCSQLLSRVPAG
jgi:hypothetical protein